MFIISSAISLWTFQTQTNFDTMQIIGFALFYLLSLILITTPLIIQKVYKLYFPPFLQIAICIFAILYTQTTIYLHTQSDTISYLVALLGGIIIAMITYSSVRGIVGSKPRKSSKNAYALKVSFLTFVFSFFVVLVWLGLDYLIYRIFFMVQTGFIFVILNQMFAYMISIFAFCVIGFGMTKKEDDYPYLIKSYKDSKQAKQSAKKNKDDKFLSVIKKHEKDPFTIKKFFISIKGKIIIGKLIYISINIAFFAMVTYAFVISDDIGYGLLITTGLTLAFNAIIYIYEFIVHKKQIKTISLYRLKMIKNIMHLLTFANTVTILFVADIAHDETTVLISLFVAGLNAFLLLLNIFNSARLKNANEKNTSTKKST